MFTRKRNVVSLFLIMFFILVNVIPCNADVVLNKEISTMKELKKEIKNITGGKNQLTQNDQKELTKITDEAVMEQFIQEKRALAEKKLNELNIDDYLKEDADGVYRGKVVIDLGDGCETEASFEDGEDEIQALASIKDYFVDEVYAATNGESLWKKYGNRYFTAKSTRPAALGAGWISLENHYKLSKNGIDERYGISDSACMSVNGTIDEKEPQITDKTARTPGKPDVNMQCKYRWTTTYPAPSLSGSGNYIMKTTIKYVAINKKDKKIKVKHSWKTTW